MGIDLNAVAHEAAAVSGELWHACAGAGLALPRRGSRVVYLPQAHLATGGDAAVSVPVPGPVPPHVVCRVVGVELCVSACGLLSSFLLLPLPRARRVLMEMRFC